MASLTSLPSEILLLIFRYVPVEDKHSLALISHRIKQIAKPIIEEHNSLTRQHGVQECAYNQPVCQTVTSLLLRALSDPLVAAYITTLRLRGWYICWESGHDRWTLHDEWLVRSKALELMPSTFWEEWTSGLESGDENLYLILLLCSLPNLTDLVILAEGFCGESTFNLLRQFLQQDKRGAILSRLRTVHLNSVNVLGDDGGSDLHTILDFANLPLIESIQLRQFDQTDATYLKERPTRYERLCSQSSRLTDLAFLDVHIGSEALSDFLGNFTSLHSFTYQSSLRNPIDSEGNVIVEDYYSLCKSLQTHFALSIRKLILHDQSRSMCFVGSLVGFEVLTFLEVEVNMVIYYDWRTGNAVQVLLPASLGILRLRCSTSDDVSGAAVFIYNIVERKDDYNPRLELITIILRSDAGGTGSDDLPSTIFQNLDRMCKAADIQLIRDGTYEIDDTGKHP